MEEITRRGWSYKLLKFYLLDFFNWSDENIKINVLGRIAELPKDLKDQIHKIEEKTKNNTGLVLNICFNYGGRDEIVTATKNIVQKVLDGELKIEDINEKLFSNYLYTASCHGRFHIQSLCLQINSGQNIMNKNF